MPSVPIINYAQDLTGVDPNNLVTGEVHVIDPSKPAIVLNYGPFYAKSVVIVDQNQNILSIGDNGWVPALMDENASMASSSDVYCFVVINKAGVTSITINYQTIGGEFTAYKQAYQDILTGLSLTNRPIYYGSLLGLPNGFPVAPHQHPMSQTYEWGDAVTAIMGIIDAIMVGNKAAMDNLMASVQNNTFASALDALNGIATNEIINPATLKYVLDSRLVNAGANDFDIFEQDVTAQYGVTNGNPNVPVKWGYIRNKLTGQTIAYGTTPPVPTGIPFRINYKRRFDSKPAISGQTISISNIYSVIDYRSAYGQMIVDVIGHTIDEAGFFIMPNEINDPNSANPSGAAQYSYVSVGYSNATQPLASVFGDYGNLPPNTLANAGIEFYGQTQITLQTIGTTQFRVGMVFPFTDVGGGHLFNTVGQTESGRFFFSRFVDLNYVNNQEPDYKIMAQVISTTGTPNLTSSGLTLDQWYNLSDLKQLSPNLMSSAFCWTTSGDSAGSIVVRLTLQSKTITSLGAYHDFTINRAFIPATTVLPTPDITPRPFTLPTTSGVPASSSQTSWYNTVFDVDPGVDVPINVTNGLWAVLNGQSGVDYEGVSQWFSGPGYVRLGDSLIFKATASATPGGVVTVNVAIGTLNIPWVITTAGVSGSVPAQFTFTPSAAQDPGVLVVSNEITISGLNTGVYISGQVTGGEVAINNGGTYDPWTSAAQTNTITNGTKLMVRGYSSTTYSASVNVGYTTSSGISSSFQINTRAIRNTPTSPSAGWTVTGAAPGGQIQVGTFTIAGMDAGATCSLSVSGAGVSYTVNGVSETTTATGFKNGDVVVVYGVASSTLSATVTGALVIAGSISVPISITTVASVTIDNTPDPFSFVAVGGFNTSTLVTSNEITLSGLQANTDIPVSALGCSYAIDNGTGYGAYMTTASVVRNGYKIKLQITSPQTLSAAATGYLTVGTFTASFVVTNRNPILLPTTFTFTPVVNADPASFYESNVVTIAGVEPGYQTTISGGGTQNVDSNPGYNQQSPSNTTWLAVDKNDGAGFGSWINITSYGTFGANVQNGYNIKLRILSSTWLADTTSASIIFNLNGATGTTETMGFSVTTKGVFQPLINPTVAPIGANASSGLTNSAMYSEATLTVARSYLAITLNAINVNGYLAFTAGGNAQNGTFANVIGVIYTNIPYSNITAFEMFVSASLPASSWAMTGPNVTNNSYPDWYPVSAYGSVQLVNDPAGDNGLDKPSTAGNLTGSINVSIRPIGSTSACTFKYAIVQIGYNNNPRAVNFTDTAFTKTISYAQGVTGVAPAGGNIASGSSLVVTFGSTYQINTMTMPLGVSDSSNLKIRVGSVTVPNGTSQYLSFSGTTDAYQANGATWAINPVGDPTKMTTGMTAQFVFSVYYDYVVDGIHFGQSTSTKSCVINLASVLTTNSISGNISSQV